MKAIVTHNGNDPPDEYSNVVQITTSGETGEAILNFGNERDSEQIELSDVKATTVIED